MVGGLLVRRYVGMYGNSVEQDLMGRNVHSLVLKQSFELRDLIAWCGGLAGSKNGLVHPLLSPVQLLGLHRQQQQMHHRHYRCRHHRRLHHH